MENRRPGMIVADPAQTQQVLVNLCMNAMQAIGRAQDLIEIAVQIYFPLIKKEIV